VIGGMLSSTVLGLVLLPALLRIFLGARVGEASAGAAGEPTNSD
jgi:Cu/Ag efflux pump CusA